MRTISAIFGAIIALFVSTAADASLFSPPTEAPETVCASAVARQERLRNLPSRLLHAISLVESGRWSQERQVSFAWPWTVTSGANGNYFPTKEEAINEVHRLQAQGVRNIDVGCMQINLRYHPDAFTNLDEAFDPTINTSYAAEFLGQLYRNAGSWLTAAAHYHSMEPTEGSGYQQKVMKFWEDAKKTIPDNPVADAPTRLASAMPPVAASPPEPTAADNVAALARTNAAIEAARRFANAWRDARLKEYETRKAGRLARLASTTAWPTQVP